MAEIITSESGNRKVSRKKLIRIDMTPMVDLGFLLITFFMFTTNFSKPNIMDLGLPAKDNHEPIDKPVIDVKNQLTFILGKDNRVFYYQKELKNLIPTDLKETSMAGMEISRIIQKFKENALDQNKFTVIIKPTNDSSYKNFVDILDNLAITHNERYGITDLKPLEEKTYKEIVN